MVRALKRVALPLPQETKKESLETVTFVLPFSEKKYGIRVRHKLGTAKQSKTKRGGGRSDVRGEGGLLLSVTQRSHILCR